MPAIGGDDGLFEVTPVEPVVVVLGPMDKTFRWRHDDCGEVCLDREVDVLHKVGPMRGQVHRMESRSGQGVN